MNFKKLFIALALLGVAGHSFAADLQAQQQPPPSSGYFYRTVELGKFNYITDGSITQFIDAGHADMLASLWFAPDEVATFDVNALQDFYDKWGYDLRTCGTNGTFTVTCDPKTLIRTLTQTINGVTTTIGQWLPGALNSDRDNYYFMVDDSKYKDRGNGQSWQLVVYLDIFLFEITKPVPVPAGAKNFGQTISPGDIYSYAKHVWVQDGTNGTTANREIKFVTSDTSLSKPVDNAYGNISYTQYLAAYDSEDDSGTKGQYISRGYLLPIGNGLFGDYEAPVYRWCNPCGPLTKKTG